MNPELTPKLPIHGSDSSQHLNLADRLTTYLPMSQIGHWLVYTWGRSKQHCKGVNTELMLEPLSTNGGFEIMT